MITWQQLLRTKDVDTTPRELVRCLSAFDLTLMGIGVIIGAGIFVLTGIAAATAAGPAIVLSFALAGIACAFSALCYAELAASVGGCGSAYGYAYVGLGELIAWIIGWDLLLEYGMCASTVAVGWSSYFNDALLSIGIKIPQALLNSPHEHGIIDLPATLIVLIITAFCAIGTQQSSKFNKIIVAIKLIVIAMFIILTSRHIHPENWHPFMPFGWSGVATGASMIFFAYIGFDAISTTAEEALNPQRDLPIGIIASLLICTFLYMVVAALLTATTHYPQLYVPSPVASVLSQLGYQFAAAMVSVGAIAGLTTCILVMFYGFSRVLLAMCRDHLLPPAFAKIHPKTHTPLRIIVVLGIIQSLFSGLMPLHDIANLVNIGTLSAFTLVCVGVLVMRKTKPELNRCFKTPGMPWVPIFGTITCLFLMFSLPRLTWLNFLIWNLIGLFIYFSYSRHHSLLAKKSLELA